MQQPLGGGQQICWRRRFPGPHGFGSLCKEVREELVPLERPPLGPSLGMEVGMLVVGRDLVLLPCAESQQLPPWDGGSGSGATTPPASILGQLCLLCSRGGRLADRALVLTRHRAGPRRRSCDGAKRVQESGLSSEFLAPSFLKMSLPLHIQEDFRSPTLTLCSGESHGTSLRHGTAHTSPASVRDGGWGISVDLFPVSLINDSFLESCL